LCLPVPSRSLKCPPIPSNTLDCRDRAATRCNSLDLNGTDSPFLILQETLWPTYWTQIGPRFLGTQSARTPKSFASNDAFSHRTWPLFFLSSIAVDEISPRLGCAFRRSWIFAMSSGPAQSNARSLPPAKVRLRGRRLGTVGPSHGRVS
jgi:hypothetical protein